MRLLDHRSSAEVIPVTRFAVPLGLLLVLGCPLACSDTDSSADETSTSTNQSDDTANARDEHESEESDSVGDEAGNEDESETETANSIDDDQPADEDVDSSGNGDGRAMEVAVDGDRDVTDENPSENETGDAGARPSDDDPPVENEQSTEASTIAPIGDDDGTTFAGICDEFCITQEEIGCPNDAVGEECIDECREGAGLLASNDCVSEYTGWVYCLTADVEGNFVCDDDGYSTPVDEACNAELEAMLACFEELGASIGDDRALRRAGSLRFVQMP